MAAPDRRDPTDPHRDAGDPRQGARPSPDGAPPATRATPPLGTAPAGGAKPVETGPFPHPEGAGGLVAASRPLGHGHPAVPVADPGAGSAPGRADGHAQGHGWETHGPGHAHGHGHGHGPSHGHAHAHAHGHGHHDPRLRRHGHARAHSWITQRPTTFWGKVKQFLWGFFFFEWYHELQHARSQYNDVMNLVLFGELLGIPLMNSSIGLRLLPYVLPDLDAWKHRQLEEHLVEEHAPHIH